MNPALTALKQHLDQMDWSYEEHEEDGLIVTGFAGDSADFEIYLEPHEERGLLKICAPYPDLAPAATHPALLDLCNRANKLAVLARLMLNPDDGRVCSAVFSAFEPGHLPESVIDYCLGACVHHCEIFHPAVLSVVYGQASPQAALEAALADDAARRAKASDDDPT